MMTFNNDDDDDDGGDDDGGGGDGDQVVCYLEACFNIQVL